MKEKWDIVAGVITTLVLTGLGFALARRSLQRSEDPAKLLFKWILTAVILVGGFWFMRTVPRPYWPALLVAMGLPLGGMWAPSMGAIVARPFTSMFDGGDVEVKPEPLYSMAEAKRQNGHFHEAIQEVRKQLEKFPDDFKGTMLLAAIQAENLNDLPGAQVTLERLLEKEKSPPAVAKVWHTLADWHLQYAQDPDAARAALERIVQGYPQTQLAHMASQRLARIGSVHDLLEAHEHRKIEARPGMNDLGLQRVGAPEKSDDPQTLAADYVEQLQRHPLDVETREKLAVLYASHFQRLDLAADQLEQLIAHPHESPQHIARWLNLLVTLHIQVNGDVPAAEQVLHRLIERFPKSAMAEKARQRLAYLGQEIKSKASVKMKTLGSYEKDLGLKRATG